MRLTHSSGVPLIVETSGRIRFEDHSGGSLQVRVSLPVCMREGQIGQDGIMSTEELNKKTNKELLDKI